MAAALKAYTGTVTNTTTTVYTVPSNRIAKVTIAFLHFPNSSSSTPRLSIAGLDIFDAPAGSAVSYTIGGQVNSVASSTIYAGQQPSYFISAGQTVAITAPASYTIRYSIGVVEEVA